MISEHAIQQLCTPAIFSRARRIAHDGETIHLRRCRYDDAETTLRAKMDASSSWEDSYRVSVVLEEDADVLVEYECDCPSARRLKGPCKHAAALVLDFNRRPELYEGYHDARHVATSRGILRLMERASQDVPAVAGASTEPAEGTVRLEPTLVYEAGFDVRFRIAGSGGSYVLRSIGEFVANVESGAYFSYGKSLAFRHVPEAFAPASRRVVDFLVRAIQNRRAYAFERTVGRGPAGGVGTPTRELHLSSPELWDLLGLFERSTIRFEDHGKASEELGAPHDMRIVDGDPSFGLELVVAGEGAYDLVRPANLRVVSSGGRALAWDEHAFYRCTPELSRRSDLLVALMRDPSEHLLIAERDMGRFLASVLPRLEEALCVAAPDELDALRPCPCELQFRLDCVRRGVTCEATAVYGEQRVPLMAPRDAERDDGQALVRDARAEARGREVLRRYFQVGEDGGLFVSERHGNALATLVFEGVGELQRVGTVFVTEAFERLRAKAHPSVKVGLSVRSNLLSLTLRAQGVPASELAGLLTSYKLKRRYHRLHSGAFVDLGDLNLDAAGAVVEELGLDPADLATGEITMPAYHALLLGDLAPSADRDESFESYVERVRSVDLASYEVPESLAGVLRPYQAEGYRWLRALSDLGLGGILADEMGLGKSVQLIAYLVATREQGRAVGPSLVVCPASLVYNWEAELRKFAPGLSVAVVAGTAEERQLLRRAGGTDVLVTSYDLIRRDVMDYARMRLWCVALDEAQYIKNHETLAARAVKSVPAAHRVALTGTPVENRLSELWSILDFLMPGLFGSYERFRDRYERPIVEEEDGLVAQRLRRAVRPFVLRREKRDVMLELPDKIEQVVYARMGSEQRVLYDAQVQELRAQLADAGDAALGREKLQILAMLMRLRQTCCDPHLLYDGYAGGSCKTDTIMTLVERTVDANEKALVFSQFTSYLDVLAAELDRRGVPFVCITGSTPKRRRVELVEQFNADDTPVFLISLKAGGTGLNLTGATVVIHADPWWNVAAQNQATDRAHRIGQTRDVTVYKVIASDTIEEHIMALQQTKAQLAESVVAGDASAMSLASLTREDLEDLLA